MTVRTRALAIGLGGLVIGLGPVLAASAPAVGADLEPRVVCRFTDERLTEISGITWSRRHPGVYWVHNDSSGGPYLYAVDGTTCRTLARIRVSGIDARDLEAVATGTDPAGRPVLWLGDIGDNLDSWPSVRLHAVPEPESLTDQRVEAVTYLFTYADRSHNAESILADPDRARVWVVTRQGVVGGVWRVPLRDSSVATATKVGPVGGLVTDAAMAPDGRRYVIRDYLVARLYDAPVSAASLRSPVEVDLPGQPQGEAITFTADGSALLVASERDDALWSVPLPTAGAGSTSATPSPTGSASPDAASSAAPESAAAAENPLVARVLAGVFLVAAAAVVVWGSRRLRR